MFRRVFLSMALLASSPMVAVAASDFVVGSKGGLYCASIDDLKMLLVDALGGASDGAGGCGVLPPFAAIRSATIFRNGPFEGGVGVIANMADKGMVAFMTVPPDESPPALVENNPDKIKFELIAKPEGVVRLSAEDLRAETRKWIGKIVETRASCFYADLNAFQCSSSHVRVDFTDIEPAAARATIERECDTAAKSSRRVCTVPLRFKYAGFSRMNGDIGATTLVKAAAAVGYVPEERIAQRRSDSGKLRVDSAKWRIWSGGLKPRSFVAKAPVVNN